MKQTPLIPAQAGIQGHANEIEFLALGPRFRGDERRATPVRKLERMSEC